MKLTPLYFTIIILILALSCAKQTSPSGGPRDSIPPQLINTFPPRESVNFSATSITLTFDEYIILNNPQEQLLVTPSIGKDFELTFRKKSAILKLNTTLEENTTYTINFRESIQDITEKNPAENLKYVFSTGSYLDSLVITGTVLEALTQKKLKDATVALYLSDTFNIFEHKPTYLTKTNDEGRFSIENLKPAQYYIYAFDDKNKNITVDSKTEIYGFLSNPITLRPDTIPDVDIQLFKLDARPLKLTSARPYNTYFNIKTSKGIKDYHIEPQLSVDSTRIQHIIGNDKASVKVYLADITPQDSLGIQLFVTDSIGFTIDTLLYAKLSERQTTPEKLNLTIDKPYLTTSTSHLTSQITFDKPMGHINFDSIRYQVDSTTVVPILPDHLSFTPTTLRLKIPIEKTIIDTLKAKLQSKTTTPPSKLIFGNGSFISIENDSSSYKDDNVTLYTPENTGTILVSVNTSRTPYIIQLLKKDFTVYDTISNTPNITFQNLTPGEYQLRLIHDKNANGVWDSGNFFTKEEPEPVLFYTNEEGQTILSIKANWELGPLLITDQHHVDKE